MHHRCTFLDGGKSKGKGVSETVVVTPLYISGEDFSFPLSGCAGDKGLTRHQDENACVAAAGSDATRKTNAHADSCIQRQFSIKRKVCGSELSTSSLTKCFFLFLFILAACGHTRQILVCGIAWAQRMCRYWISLMKHVQGRCGGPHTMALQMVGSRQVLYKYPQSAPQK